MICRVDECQRNARWQAVVLMAPPGAPVSQPPLGFPSPLVVCDKHKRKGRLRAVDALGPNGMELLTAAFMLMKKQAPLADDLGIDWIAYDGGELQFGDLSTRLLRR